MCMLKHPLILYVSIRSIMKHIITYQRLYETYYHLSTFHQLPNTLSIGAKHC